MTTWEEYEDSNDYEEIQSKWEECCNKESVIESAWEIWWKEMIYPELKKSWENL